MKWCRPFGKYSSLPTKSHMMNRRKWRHVKCAFLSLFYWEKFEKGCYLLILYFSLELQPVTHVTWWLTPNSPCFLGESQLVTSVTLQFFKDKYVFLNAVLHMLPTTIQLKTLQTGCYTWCYTLCYVCYALTFLLHVFAWSLHLPNIDVTTEVSKYSECK